MAYTKLALTPEIRDLLRKPENEVETVHFRPIHWEDSRGLLIGRYEKLIGQVPGNFGVTEWVDVYLDKAQWVEVSYNKNRGTHKSEYTESVSKGVTKTEGSERTMGIQLGFEKIIKGGFSVEDKRMTITSTTTGSSSGQKHYLDPGQELFVYRRRFKFKLEAWWVVDTQGKQRIVAQTATNYTHRASVERTIEGDDEIFFKSLAGEKTIKLSPSPEKPESSWEQIHYGALPEAVEHTVNMCWTRALHPGRSDLPADMPLL